MNKHIFPILGILALAFFQSLEMAIAAETDAAAALIRRVVPARADSFSCEVIPAENGMDVFEIESRDGKIVLRGNNGVAIASALNWYLKNCGNCDISWCGDQLALANPPPPVPGKIRVANPHRWRVYFNYCTLSYTASWWDWERWQREVDFMAMNGVNMPLCPIGLEGVWYNTLLKYGFTDLEAREFLVGPAFFAWQWMTNIEGHGGPLPKSWIDSHVELGRKILARERELGMTPIQQGFSGYVPRKLKEKFPDAAIAQQPNWCGFPGSTQLDPLDPLFPKLGRAFIEEEIKLFGTSHVYGADPFHESSPPKPGEEYLQKVGQTIIALMTNVDPKATWAMQAWSIRKGIATAVPKDRLLVLDLGGGAWHGETPFWGYDFIVGQLHNFGGRINMHGDLANVAENPFVKSKVRPNAVGCGLFMEATTQNPVFYNLYFDMTWRTNAVEVADWLNAYARRRYGADSDAARQAWTLLLKGPYKKGTSGVESSSIIAARPALHAKKSGPNAGFQMPYEPKDLAQAWELLLQDADKLKASDGYRFDVADVGRQVLSNLGQEFQKEATASFRATNAAAFKKSSQQFLELLDDVDSLIGTRPEYHFGKWIADARRWGATDAERELMEKNASMLVTIWGPEKTPQIFDYSWREWSGLISTYYRPRWQMFFDHLAGCLARGEVYKEEGLPQQYGHEAFRANAFYDKLADWEIAWVGQHKELPAAPSGDAVAIALKLLAKYRPLIAGAYSEERQLRREAAARAADAAQFGQLIGKWTPKNGGGSWHVLELDMTPFVKQEGEYEIRFQYESGGNRLEIKSVALLQGGSEISADKHDGRTGNEHINNTYRLKLDALAFGTKYTLRAEIRTDGGDHSNGSVWLRKR